MEVECAGMQRRGTSVVGTIVIVFIFSLHVFQTMPRFLGLPRGICVPCTTALSVLLALHMVAGDRAQVLASMSICHIKSNEARKSLLEVRLVLSIAVGTPLIAKGNSERLTEAPTQNRATHERTK